MVSAKEQTLIFGLHPVIELLRAKKRKITHLFTTKPVPKQWHYMQALLPSYPIDIKHVSRDELSRLAGTTDHQGVVAYAQPFVTRNKPFESKKYPFIVVLDGIQDPRNLGAIIRSASCTNMSGILITQKHSAPLNAVAFKASAGLAEHMSIRFVPSAEVAVAELQGAGYKIYSTLFEGADACTMPFAAPCALVIGSEGVGISNIFKKVGTAITLPQRAPDISYNVSVAAGILFFLVASRVGRI